VWFNTDYFVLYYGIFVIDGFLFRLDQSTTKVITVIHFRHFRRLTFWSKCTTNVLFIIEVLYLHLFLFKFRFKGGNILSSSCLLFCEVQNF